jgi:hypothetical protein
MNRFGQLLARHAAKQFVPVQRQPVEGQCIAHAIDSSRWPETCVVFLEADGEAEADHAVPDVGHRVTRQSGGCDAASKNCAISFASSRRYPRARVLHVHSLDEFSLYPQQFPISTFFLR